MASKPDLYTRATANKAKLSTRIIMMPGGKYAVTGVPGLFSLEEAKKMDAKLAEWD